MSKPHRQLRYLGRAENPSQPGYFLHTLLLTLGCALLPLPLPLSSHQAFAQFPPDNLVTHSTRGRDALRVTTTLNSPPAAIASVAKISIVAPKPAPADRDLEVVVYIKNYGSNPVENTAYRQVVRLAEGTSRAEAEFVFAQPRMQFMWDVRLLEDGRDIENKPPPNSNNFNINTFPSDHLSTASLGLLAEGESQAELGAAVRSLADRLHPDVAQTNFSQTTGLPINSAPLKEISQASVDWRSYLAYDFIVLTPAGVAEVNQHADVAEALRACVAAGGQLLLISITEPTDLEQVDKLLCGVTADSPTAFTPQVWCGTTLDKAGFVRLDSDSSLFESLKQHTIIQREFGFGAVLLSDRAPDKFPTPPENAAYVAIRRPAGTFFADADSDWFWRNLIQAVGKPPVWMFCAIVTLFGALLGPGLLILTGRLQRRSLMIFLVPAISLLASLAIVVYGVFNEGFETHVRITSVQAIDGDANFGFAWSRQNYFSGLPPREGLLFSAHTFARPVNAETSNGRYYGNLDPRSGVSCTVNLEADKQRWSGWLRPRQQQQLLVGHSIAQVELPIELTRVSDTTLSLKNSTAGILPIVVVRGAEDDYYVAEQLAAGQAVEVKAIHPTRAAAQIAKLMVDYRPETPPELGEGGSLLDFGVGSRRYAVPTGATNYSSPDILNQTFQRWLSDKMQIPKFGFAVLASQSSAVEVPLAGTQADSLHLIVGIQTW